MKILVTGFVLLLALPAAAEDAGPPPAVSMTEAIEGDAGYDEGITEMLAAAVAKLAKARNEEGLALLAKKDYPGALERLKQAWELDPANAEIVNNLGHIYRLLGNNAEAERLYREAMTLDSTRFIVYLNLAEILGRKEETVERVTEAAGLLVRAREIRGNMPRVILRQARVARLLGAFDDAERFYREYLSQRKPTDRLKLELGDFYRDLGRPEDALDWYQQIEDDDELGKTAAGRIWEIEVERQARRFGWARTPEAIPSKARAMAGRGRILLNQRRYSEAERLLSQAVVLAPGFAMARADLGDLLRNTGRVQMAELSYLRAIAIDHGNAEIYARLGKLYLEEFDTQRSAEAAVFLSRALDLRPDWHELRLELARSLQGGGDLVGALSHVERFLAAIQAGSGRTTALKLKRDIEQLMARGKGRQPMPAVEFSEPLSPELTAALGRARAHLVKGRPEAAMAELGRLSQEQRGVQVRNLEARILYASGRLDDAARSLEESLEIDSKQADVHEQLGVVEAERGHIVEARRHFVRAEKLGSQVALFHLARLDVDQLDDGMFGAAIDLLQVRKLLGAQATLKLFLRRGSASIYLDEGRQLQRQLAERIFAAFVVLAAIVALLVVLIIIVAVRRWGGDDLAALTRRFPESGPEVQRVLSAIRHEVLKHNTMALGGLVEAIENGDESATKRLLQHGLFADPDRQSVAERLNGYAKELEQIGRSYGLRLNLRRKDPALRALLRGFDLLGRIAQELQRLPEYDPGEWARVGPDLKTAFRLLNEEGYGAVQRLLDQLRILEVDIELLAGIHERVRTEPAFADIQIADLVFEIDVKMPCGILIGRQAFEDIMANLFRNAVQSSATMDTTSVEIGLAVSIELDVITGLERVVFCVRDRSEKVLTTEMIRGRYIEEGLGLTADLILRYDGTVDVLPGKDGWSKAVRVRLPRVFTGGAQGEES
jgi:tetratricopeptide (TPR) repeat protein